MLHKPLLALAALALIIPATQPNAQQPSEQPIIIAHRGASGYLPEHTLPAYAMAHAQRADYIEPDLVMTKDGVLICLHDIHLEATTDVQQRFPNRARDDGKWYAADFTLAEIKTLAVHERLNGRFPRGLADFRIPTFAEMIELVQGLNASTGRNAGIYPELKAPSWHRRQGLPMEQALLEILKKYGYDQPGAKVYIQCFEAGPLEHIRHELGSDMPQILLIGGGAGARTIFTPEGMQRVATFAEGIGPSKTIIERNPEIVTLAAQHGLKVHPYTLRADDVPQQYGSHEQELAQFFNVYAVDGIFTDFPDRARLWLDQYLDRAAAASESEPPTQ